MDYFKNLEEFYLSFDGEKGVFGKSAEGRNLYYLCVEKTSAPTAIFQYAIHAREFVTTYLCYLQAEDFKARGKVGKIYFIPSMNPDGVNICLSGKPLYKANARRVDLNVNFDARWGEGKNNLIEKSDENYIGEYPFSEPETIALRDFTLKVMPNVTVSYHSKGEEIYYFFGQTGKALLRDALIAQKLSESTGYKVLNPVGSVGGYKDWCVERLKIPSFTIEVGSDEYSHPIGSSVAEEIFIKNKNVCKVVTESLWNTAKNI